MLCYHLRCCSEVTAAAERLRPRPPIVAAADLLDPLGRHQLDHLRIVAVRQRPPPGDHICMQLEAIAAVGKEHEEEDQQVEHAEDGEAAPGAHAAAEEPAGDRDQPAEPDALRGVGAFMDEEAGRQLLELDGVRLQRTERRGVVLKKPPVFKSFMIAT